MPGIEPILALWISVSVLAAEKPAAPQPVLSPMAERPARMSSRDLKIPRALVHKIESDYRAFLTKNEVSMKENIKRQLLNLSVELTQKRQVALHEDTRVVTPVGGGVIDLSDLVTPLRGSFRMRLLARKSDGSEPAGLHVYFVSGTRARVVDGETYGAGCGKYMEITGYYQKKAAAQGFELYSADQRYLSVIGGTFVTVAFDKEALWVGSVNFTDSRYPKVFCE